MILFTAMMWAWFQLRVRDQKILRTLRAQLFPKVLPITVSGSATDIIGNIVPIYYSFTMWGTVAMYIYLCLCITYQHATSNHLLITRIKMKLGGFSHQFQPPPPISPRFKKCNNCSFCLWKNILILIFAVADYVVPLNYIPSTPTMDALV